MILPFSFSLPFDFLDILAVAYFLVCWLVFAKITTTGLGSHTSLSNLMDKERKHWMLLLARRELRIVDTSIIAGLQNGTAFFASSSLLAIGGCFAMFGATDEIAQIHTRLASDGEIFMPIQWELKLLGLAMIFAYAFFKFGWSYRLFNYCSIIIGNIPFVADAESDETTKQVSKATNLNIIAAKHFNAGLRGIFFAIGYVGWFVGPFWLFTTSTLIAGVLIRRQFFSAARQALIEKE